MPASIGQSDEDSDDALEAIIQQELAKFQQQQADRYAVLLAEGQAVLPLPSPAPDQQQLRALQRQQESLAGEACHTTVRPAATALRWSVSLQLGQTHCSSLMQPPSLPQVPIRLRTRRG